MLLRLAAAQPGDVAEPPGGAAGRCARIGEAGRPAEGRQNSTATIGGMFAAPVWHYWIGAVLMLLAVIPATVMLFIGYLRKTQSPRYPSDD